MSGFDDNAVLPEGWALAKLGDGLVVEVTPGFACGTHNREGTGVPHLRPMNVNSDGRIDLLTLKYVPTQAAQKAGKWLQHGDVLFNNTNSAELVGKTALYDLSESLAFSNHMTRVRVREDGLDPQFCALLLHANWLGGDFQARCNQHVSQASIGREALLGTPIPVPPLAEQKRIASRIVALRKRVDNARRRLANLVGDRKEGEREIPSILKRFRQAVLAAACSGQLTAEWREATASTSTGAELLLQIGRERQAAEAQSRRSRRRDDEDEDSSGAEPVTWEVPDSWELAKISDLLHYERSAAYGVLQPGSDLPDGVPFVRVCDLGNGTVDTSHIKRIASDIDKQYPRTRLQGDEVLVTLVGTIGRVAVVPKELAGANVARAIGMLPLCPHVLPQYLRFALDNPAKNTELVDLAREVARKTLNLGLLKAVTVPLPPEDEQLEIVRRVETLLALADKIATRARATSARIERLTQAIFSKAFSGELVPTEAELARLEGRAFESGEELLQRIRETPPPRQPKVIRVHIEDTLTLTDEVHMRKIHEVSATHLHDILKKNKAGLSPEKLFDESGIEDVDDFYTQLKREVEAGKVRERRKDKKTVILEAVR